MTFMQIKNIIRKELELAYNKMFYELIYKVTDLVEII